MSGVEIMAKKYLEELGIAFEYQYSIKKNFVVDFLVENTVIQVDGEYWHGHPRFAPFTERQIKQQARDAAQDKYLVVCGYTVIRIWESDVTPENIANILNLPT